MSVLDDMDYMSDVAMQEWEYSCKKYKDIKKWVKRYCLECWWECKISKKWNVYCSNICWDNKVTVNEKNIEKESNF